MFAATSLCFTMNHFMTNRNGWNQLINKSLRRGWVWAKPLLLLRCIKEAHVRRRRGSIPVSLVIISCVSSLEYFIQASPHAWLLSHSGASSHLLPIRQKQQSTLYCISASNLIWRKKYWCIKSTYMCLLMYTGSSWETIPLKDELTLNYCDSSWNNTSNHVPFINLL